MRSGVVHRLDVGTTGALLFATEEESWRRLRGAFSAHRLDKRYRALVAGRFEERARVDLSLAITRHQPAHVAVRDDGRLTRQRVTPIEVFDDATLVEILTMLTEWNRRPFSTYTDLAMRGRPRDATGALLVQALHLSLIHI